MKIKSKYTPVYLDHLQRVCNSEIRNNIKFSEFLCKVNISAHNFSNARLSEPFNLVFDFLPSVIGYYIPLAASFEHHLFSNIEFLNSLYMYKNSNFNHALEPKLATIARLSSIEPDRLAYLLTSFEFHEENFLYKLVNRKDPELLFALENVLQIHTYPTVLTKFDEESKNHFLLELLHSVGCNIPLIEKITGFKTKTIQRYFTENQNKSIICEQNKKITIGQKDHTKKRFFNKRMHFSNINLYFMLMLSLYTMCSRVLSNKLPSLNQFDKTVLPKEISIILAVASFHGVYLIRDYFKQHQKNHPISANYCQEFPRFAEFYALLEMYHKNKCEVVACSECNTPYLNLCDDKDKTSLKNKYCPICKCNLDYDLSDSIAPLMVKDF